MFGMVDFQAMAYSKRDETFHLLAIPVIGAIEFVEGVRLSP
jgi:hypothetical protein